MMPDDRDCPFPGMDPFFEAYRWRDLHGSLIPDIRDALNDQLPWGFKAVIEERIVLTDSGGEPAGEFVGDGAVIEYGGGDGATVGGTAAVAEPVGGTFLLTTPAPVREEQDYLEVRESDTNRLVTVLEVLSPWNKTGDGRDAYLAKRNALLRTEVHLVEFDLLRGGRRLPTVEPLPQRDYFAFVSDADERPSVRTWAWNLPEPLPSLYVPLRPGRSVRLDLQRVFRLCYERASYRKVLDYTQPVRPALPPDRQAWVAERLAAAGLA